MAAQVADHDAGAMTMHGGFDEVEMMRLSIDRISPFERNPRHNKNPEYDRIKASIRANGLDQPLVITQRPDSSDYIVHSGGNTRLLILKELHEETGNYLFSHVQCVFKPWSQESDVLLAHLRENDLRGSLTFIDKALAVYDFKRLLEEELKIEELSQRNLQKALAEGGYRLSQGLISQMGYAVTRLLPLIPIALNAGLGRPQIQRIRALDRAAFAVWKKYALGNEADFNEVFATLCKRYDTLEWDIMSLQSAIETEIAEQAEISLQLIRVELDAQIAGREVQIPEINEDDFDTDDSGVIESTEMSASSSKNGNNDNTNPNSDPNLHAVGSDNAEDLTTAPLPDEPTATVEQKLTTIQSGPTDLKLLRGRAWTLATQLAQHHGIGDLVIPLSGQGFGFILRDVPDPALSEQLDENDLSQVSMVWWHLAASAEMTVAPVEYLAPLLPSDSILRRALEQQDAGLLFDSIWTLDPGHTGHQLWRRLTEGDWNDLLNLMDTYRQIHHLAQQTDARLWG